MIKFYCKGCRYLNKLSLPKYKHCCKIGQSCSKSIGHCKINNFKEIEAGERLK